MRQLADTGWDAFVALAPGGSFLQSWGWGEAQRAFGVPVWRLSARENEELAGTALVLERLLPGGQCWLYVPRGPLWGEHKLQSTNSKLVEQIVALAKEQRAIFVRCEPAETPPDGSGWQKADRDVQPRHTLVVDVSRPEDELLSALHHKTRYNIGLARRHGVAVRFSQEAADVEAFLALTREVAARTTFRFHPDEYYRALYRVLARGASQEVPRAALDLAVAEYGGDVLAVHWLISFGDTITYVHGASSSRRRELMAPHLLQWESMRRANVRGFRYYDLYGVAPQSSAGGRTAGQAHPWSGITRFKEGFGGRLISYAGAYDLVLNPLAYWLYSAARRLRR